jgi:plastocyanin
MMNRGTRGALVAIACGALAGIPALARAQQQDPDTGTVMAQDVNGIASGRWVVNGDPSATTVTIATGGTVDFSYPSGASHHNVSFTHAQPASCSGLPANPFANGGPGWSGSCRFDHAGTYEFVCSVHPYDMIGTVVVKDQPAATATPGATPTPAGGPYATPTPTADPPPATLRGAVKLAAHQRGTHVRGSVRVRSARSRVEVALAVRRSALTGGHSTKLVRVGRWHKTASRAARVAFSVPLTTTGRAALAKLGKLPLTVTVRLTAPGGHKASRTLHTTLRPG